MRKTIKKVVKNIVLGEKADSKRYVKFLNEQGASVSETAWFVAPTKVTIDLTRPYLISIGEYVTVTEGVVVLTHGFDWSVLKKASGQILGSAGHVTIEDNVFIGANSTILKGVTIGHDSIIGAGSLVTKDIPSRSVAIGSPCRPVMSIDEYREKRERLQIEEAQELVRCYYKKYGANPSMSELAEFCMLFASEEEILDIEAFRSKALYGLHEGETWTPPDHCPPFESYASFLQSVSGVD